jgi:DNA-binding GntR family transcriptional regulator
MKKKVIKVKMRKEKTLFSQKAYLLIKEMILGLKISPKEPISESSLASKFGISRTPVREALKKLQSDNLINSYDKRGYFLNISTINGIKDLYETRAFLEGGAAKLAAQRIDLVKLEKFEKQYLSIRDRLSNTSGSENKTKNIPNLMKLGKQFHFLIIKSAENEKLEELIENIYSQIEISRVYSYSKRGTEAIDEHLKIIGALKNRNGERSRTYMEKHLMNAFNMLTRVL